MRMEIEANMKEDKPTYIIGFDVKGGYNNVNLDLLEEKFNELILRRMKLHDGTSDEQLATTKTLFQHIINNPTMKIWKNYEEIKMQRGV